MKIERIKLYNFSSYEGENVFDFSCESDKKNIVLIGGKNGAGKTSLFTAIKVALYGPLAYGYVGTNSYYIAKIKDLINTKAFQQDKVKTEVQITISLKIEREIREYVITRKWNYTRKKLSEDYYVERDGEKLPEQELSYFQNYLQSIVPPDLFEFFLFDGEEVGNIFSSSSYNTYVKNAVFTLCGMDVFEIIRKYTSGYVSKTGDSDNNNLYIEYEAAKREVERLEEREASLKKDIKDALTSLNDIEVQFTELGTAFKNAGGITVKDRRELETKFKNAEARKAEAAAKIKLFVEGIMPFLIVADISVEMKNQLAFEEQGEIFQYISEKLAQTDIECLLEGEGITDKQVAEKILTMLLSKFKPEVDCDNRSVLFDLSRAEMNYAHGMISSIENFNKDEMIHVVNDRIESANMTAEINRILKGAMCEEDAIRFAEKENYLLKKKEDVSAKYFMAQKEYGEAVHDLEVQKQIKDRIFQSIKENTKNGNVYKLSSGLSSIMEQLLKQKTLTLRKQLEELIVQNLKHIYRKNNLITHIEITEDFQFNLYQDETFGIDEILYLIKNLGTVGFCELIGEQGTRKLFETYATNSITEVKELLEKDNNLLTSIELFKKIELNRLSKGERQIFILALYWAIIMISGQDIPFIIDTPYARIDANHRKEISEKFFPNISKQVIILSTDEEINEEYYGILKPYISKEYMLLNDENQNRTSIENHYFFEV